MHWAETSKFTFLLLYCELSIDHKVKPCALNVCSAGEIFTPYSSCFKAIDQILFAWHFLDSMWIKWLFRDGCLQPLLIKECSPARRHLQTLLWHTWGESHALSTLQPHYSCSGRLLVGRAGPSFHIATAASLTMPTGTIENKLKTGQAAESHILLTWDCKNDKLYICCYFHSTNNVINLLQYSTDHLVSISQRQNCVFHHPSPYPLSYWGCMPDWRHGGTSGDARKGSQNSPLPGPWKRGSQLTWLYSASSVISCVPIIDLLFLQARSQICNTYIYIGLISRLSFKTMCTWDGCTEYNLYKYFLAH